VSYRKLWECISAFNLKIKKPEVIGKYAITNVLPVYFLKSILFRIDFAICIFYKVNTPLSIEKYPF
jgi:hypothetical protein